MAKYIIISFLLWLLLLLFYHYYTHIYMCVFMCVCEDLFIFSFMVLPSFIVWFIISSKLTLFFAHLLNKRIRRKIYLRRQYCFCFQFLTRLLIMFRESKTHCKFQNETPIPLYEKKIKSHQKLYLILNKLYHLTYNLSNITLNSVIKWIK